jgi:hypothetical protein
MSVTEESRHRLHQKLDETIGPEDATTLMEHLPPVGWADVATKTDLAHLEERLVARFEVVDAQIAHQAEIMDHRFATVGVLIEGIDERFEKLDKRLDDADQRQASLERRIDSLINDVVRHVWQVVGFIAVMASLLMAAAKLL